MGKIKDFIKHHYRHFNSAVVVDAAEAYDKFLKEGNKMMVTLAGAMSTAELGLSLAEMIRQEEVDLLNNKFNRVTDTCIPEEEAMRRIEKQIIKLWKRADEKGERYFPFEFMYQMIREGMLTEYHQMDPKDSWLLAACGKTLPLWTPGWEDSTLVNIFVALTNGRGKNYYGEDIKNIATVKSGLEAMSTLIDWYLENTKKNFVG